MFTNDRRQEERTGRYGTPRLQYLQDLVTRFQNAADEETKEKIVANLANFAYDPYNYKSLQQLNVLELFLDCITEPNEKLVEFGVGGICNACAGLFSYYESFALRMIRFSHCSMFPCFLMIFIVDEKWLVMNLLFFFALTELSADPANAAIITQCSGIPLIIQCLSSPVGNTVNYALGALYYLCNESNKEEILKPEVIDLVQRYAAAGAVSTSFSNLANAFLEKHAR
ncbi:hypothetical protein SAY87_020712 [Trapa incisa]|uniref:Armadillo repeat-containing protein 7 n=1 Tax=Trapa incisa TaxID=236973 RepID=A0AAN7JR29_9MYRT|nr:hypothetical protein SAY87_020712 [Trapa incisa]